jgi:DegV family protein with EDD domain
MKHLDGDKLATALISGINSVIGDQEDLNRINVFPVADGDTGTNLALSLGAALPLLSAPEEKHLGRLLAAVADSLLDGARGNSGAIVAQFFQGVSDSAGELSRFTTYTFGKAMRQGAEYAHDALSNPREGTILSVIAAFADYVAHHANKDQEGDFAPLMQEALGHTEKALAETPEQLDVLRKAGVVDAGAKGFVSLLRGMHAFIVHGRVEEQPDLAILGGLEAVVETAGSDADSEYRFCTECIVNGSDIDRRKLREALSELGDSLVLAGTKRKAKIHIHVNDPEDVFELARSYGEISAEKADDMHRQTHSTHDHKKHFAVITDSAADIADEDLERLDIHMVPCRLQFGNRGYLDKISISAAEFFEELRRNPNHPTTSQPAPGDFRRQFQFLASHYPDVLSINLTSIASGTWQAAVSAAERSNAPGKIHVIDSRNASLGQGLLAVYAAECADAGHDIDTTRTAINALLDKTATFALIDDMRFAVRGGRVPPWVGTLARAMRLTPIIRTMPDGRVATASFQLGRRNRIKRFARYIARQTATDRPVNIAIGDALNKEGLQQLEQHLRHYIKNVNRFMVTEIGAALGVHAGPGSLVASVQPVYAAGELDDASR